MKVVHVISGLRGGGAEHFVLELCIQSKIHGDAQMSVLSLSGADDIAHKFEHAGVSLIKIPKKGNNRRGIKAWSGFKTLLQTDANIIHAHMFHACVVACLVKLLRPSIKIVFTLHNDYVPQWHRRIILFATRPLRNVDVIFPGFRRKWFQKSKSRTISTGVDVERFTSLHGHKPPVFTCAFVGRLEEEKNPLALIDIAKDLQHRHNFLIRVAGDGSLRNKLQQQIRDHKLENNFIVHGMVEDVPQLLSESHCLLITSHWEGMPLVLLEAGAAGIPVISTPVGNISTILNSNNGSFDTLDEFPQLIEQVMDNYGDALIKARNLMHKVQEDFSIEKCYNQHVSLYRQL